MEIDWLDLLKNVAYFFAVFSLGFIAGIFKTKKLIEKEICKKMTG